MSCCNPGFCCGCTNTLPATVPSTLTAACCHTTPTTGPCIFKGCVADKWYCTFMADTVGVGWRAFYGKVDPWTKGNLNATAAAALVKASGGTLCACQALKQACISNTSYLKSIKACPSCAGTDCCCAFKKLLTDGKTFIIWLTVAAVAILLLMYATKR
jgi:hypothetical protein